MFSLAHGSVTLVTMPSASVPGIGTKYGAPTGGRCSALTATAGRKEGSNRMTSTLAERIDCLFRTQRSPRGREYTYREVAAAVSGQNGVKFSPAYLWQLRTGARDTPTLRHIEALARFFGVAPSYFFDEELTDLPEAHLP